jgi:prepilin-type N-terminal cleavage/methylation domain-containing protein
MLNNSMLILKNKNGFTLVELIASLVLAGILAIALTTIIITAINGFFLSKDAASISQKSQLALTRIRTEVINATQITTAGQDKIVFVNDSGTYEIERVNQTITLKKTGTDPIPAKALTDDIETGYYTGGNKFLTYEKTGSVPWATTDDISELYAIIITLKFSNYNSVFQTTINPRANALRNAPKLVLKEIGRYKKVG